MIQARLFVMNQEIDLLWTDMNYVRGTRANGKPATEIQGGLISVCFATRPDTGMVLRWMTKDSADDTLREADKMEKGKVCFYRDGYDFPPTRTYEFNDAHVVDFTEVFDSEGFNPLQTIMTISPGIQNYGVEVIKPWNVSYVPPSEAAPFQAEEAEEKDEPKFLGFHFENEQGVKIGQDNIKINDVIYLFIQTENAEGEKITISLDDDDLDYKHNGKVLKDDVLKGVSVTGDVTKVKLTAVAQEK